jgi:hypothetical protein
MSTFLWMNLRQARGQHRDIKLDIRNPGNTFDPYDHSIRLNPFPKIGLGDIFYLPNEAFPASATCLFSSNALSFMLLDGSADLAEYTSKRIIQLVEAS